MPSKTCFVCLFDKPVDSFYPHSKMKDGRLNKCKDCTKAAVIANRNAKIDHYRSFDRARANLPHRVKARSEYQKTDAYKLAQAIGAKNGPLQMRCEEKRSTLSTTRSATVV